LVACPAKNRIKNIAANRINRNTYFNVRDISKGKPQGISVGVRGQVRTQMFLNAGFVGTPGPADSTALTAMAITRAIKRFLFPDARV
jgi:hypothetical protein